MSSYLKEDIHLLTKNSENKRFIRLEEASKIINYSVVDTIEIARAAGALYQLPRITLVYRKRLVEYMRHLYRIPGTSKIVEKKFVRVGEGSITYSIGRHRFIEMARAAGAVYKIGSEKGSQVLINLECFDAYMEKFRQISTETEEGEN